MSDDLTTGLRELAEAGQAAPSVPGMEIRRRAGVRRRRRRTVAAVAGVSGAAALGITLLLGLTGPDAGNRSPAGTPAGTPSTQAAPSATVDLTRRVLSVGGRELPVSAGRSRTATPTGRMTVTAREKSKAVSGEAVGFEGDYTLNVPWVVELRGKDGSSTFFGALFHDAEAPGRYDTTSGWIGLGPGDAKWLYGHLRVGDVVDVKGGGSTAKNPPSAGGDGSG
ncbi:L,D-transpeptidase [Streptomyces sp. NPDC006314]|uniref:L,D-transpeptidase n=1 Tax=Streptomyces sp. NPDC006314 TaxID=3154475 RepID=UPI0033B3EC71